jgi:hypothetical protein
MRYVTFGALTESSGLISRELGRACKEPSQASGFLHVADIAPSGLNLSPASLLIAFQFTNKNSWILVLADPQHPKPYQMAVAENGLPREAISSVQVRTNTSANHSVLREPNLPPKPLNLPHPEYSTPRGVSPLISVPQAGIKYPNYTPFKLPDLVEHPFVDKAIGSDPQKHNF